MKGSAPIGLAALSALRLWGWEVIFAPEGPLGTDPAIWGLTALDLRAGNPPLAVPLYPWFAGLWEDPVAGGLAVSALAAWLLPAVAWWAARPLGARAAGAAGLAALLLPDPTVYAFQLQPDALFALWAVALGGALMRPSWALAVPLAAAGAVLREHGGPALALVLGAALAWQGSGRARLGRAAALLVLALALPPLLGGALGPGQPWSARTEEALGLLTTDERPPHLRQEQWQDFRERGPAGRAVFHARRALSLAPDSLAWLLLAGLAAGGAAWRRRELRPALALLPALPALSALLLWSERRHVAALAPLATVVLAAALAALSLPRPGADRDTSSAGAPPGAQRAALALATALGGALLLAGLTRLPEEGRRQRAESQAFPPVQAVAAAVCALAHEGDRLLTLDQRLVLWCPLPQLADPSAPEAWRAWLVAPPRSVQAPWAPVDRSPGEVWIWRLEPAREPRPCEGVSRDPARYLLASGPTPHPAFPSVPMPGRPPIALPYPGPCEP